MIAQTGKFFSVLVAALAGFSAVEAQTPPATPRAAQTILLTLEDALRIASGESETVWVAEAGAMRALGGERSTRSGLFPQLSGSASYTRTLRSQFSGLRLGGTAGADLQDLPFGRVNQYSLGLSLSQLVFDAGQTRTRLQASRARRRSAEIDVGSARAETLLDTTGAYFDALLADRLVEIAEASLGQQEEILRQTQVARQVGDKSEFELLRAQVARDNQLPLVIQSRSQRQEAYDRLKQLLNVPFADELRLTTGLAELPARFAQTADLSPDTRAPVRQAAENVQANQALLAGARGERWPSVFLSSRYNPVAYPANGVPEISQFREDWTITVSLSVPLLTWGRLAGDELAARGNLSEARARLQQAREAATLDVQLARNQLGDAEATLKSNESTVTQAQRGFQIAQIRYREGLSSQIELADSRLLLEQAEVNRARAQRNVQVARARLALLADLPLGGNTVLPSVPQTPAPTQQSPPAQPVAASPLGGTTFTGLPGGPGSQP